MLTSSINIETLDLQVLKLNTATVIERELLMDGLTIEMWQRELPERMAHQLVAQLRVPAQTLQVDRVIHRYPATLWDHIKQRLRVHFPVLKRWLPVLYSEVKLNEHLIYPTVRVPEPFANSVRLYVRPDFDTAIA